MTTDPACPACAGAMPPEQMGKPLQAAHAQHTGDREQPAAPTAVDVSGQDGDGCPWAAGASVAVVGEPGGGKTSTADWTALMDEAQRLEAAAAASGAPQTTGTTALGREYARLRRIEKARKAESTAAKEAADKIEEQLLDLMLEESVDKFSVDGTLVFPHTDVRANKNPEVTDEQFHAALRAADLAAFIKPTVSAQTLAAYVREQEKQGETIPDALKDVLNVHHITRLRTRG